MMADQRHLERTCVLAAAAVYAWLVTDGHKTPIAKVGWCIPVMFAILGLLRAVVVAHHLKSIGTNIKRIEAAHLTESTMPSGWEHFIDEPDQNRRAWDIVTALFWIAFLSLTVIAAGIYGR
jgi:hypothetical protein